MPQRRGAPTLRSLPVVLILAIAGASSVRAQSSGLRYVPPAGAAVARFIPARFTPPATLALPTTSGLSRGHSVVVGALVGLAVGAGTVLAVDGLGGRVGDEGVAANAIQFGLLGAILGAFVALGTSQPTH